MNKEIHAEIAVIGGGAAGLMTTKKLAELGYDVALIEKGETFASGPSTRNEGWLHRGTVHTGVIEDKGRAFQIAERVMYGYEEIMKFAPEIVEDLTSKTYALFKDEVLASSTQKRWDELDVWYQEMDLKALFNRDPQLNPDLISRAYKTKDKSVNFRMLYQKLLSVAENYGVKTQLNAEVVPTREDQVDLIHKDGSVSPLHADIFIYTTGLAANETFNFLESTITARFWKSHSIIVPRLSLNGFFFVDPREVSIMPHGKYSIVCQSEDDFQIETPNFEVVPEMAEQVFESLLRLMPNVEEYRNAYHANACVKPDIIKGSDSPRSVDIELHEPTPNHFVVFPGKVTESPYMADRIVKTIFERKSDPRISLRPGDIIYPAYENKE